MHTNTEGEDLQEMEAATAAEVAGGTQSVLDKIKARKAKRKDEWTVDVPGWDGDLKATYKVLEKDDIEEMIRRVRSAITSKEAKVAATNADLSFLVKACVKVEMYDIETDKTEYLSDGYTMDLAGMLDPRDPETGDPIPVNSPPELVAYLTGYNGIALAVHAQAIASWMQDPSKKNGVPQ